MWRSGLANTTKMAWRWWRFVLSDCLSVQQLSSFIVCRVTFICFWFHCSVTAVNAQWRQDVSKPWPGFVWRWLGWRWQSLWRGTLGASDRWGSDDVKRRSQQQQQWTAWLRRRLLTHSSYQVIAYLPTLIYCTCRRSVIPYWTRA